ncbi:unnamed protein product [Acanthoscelides obtectus]|nr:unnamed protein product [Acanthoscelides obtectus]CAK1660311.1 hypothetical protein AOBTE_LOCUS21982 [Acanthoscelides obtectus]
MVLAKRFCCVLLVVLATAAWTVDAKDCFSYEFSHKKSVLKCQESCPGECNRVGCQVIGCNWTSVTVSDSKLNLIRITFCNVMFSDDE